MYTRISHSSEEQCEVTSQIRKKETQRYYREAQSFGFHHAINIPAFQSYSLIANRAVRPYEIIAKALFHSYALGLPWLTIYKETVLQHIYLPPQGLAPIAYFSAITRDGTYSTSTYEAYNILPLTSLSSKSIQHQDPCHLGQRVYKGGPTLPPQF